MQTSSAVFACDNVIEIDVGDEDWVVVDADEVAVDDVEDTVEVTVDDVVDIVDVCKVVVWEITSVVEVLVVDGEIDVIVSKQNWS